MPSVVPSLQPLRLDEESADRAKDVTDVTLLSQETVKQVCRRTMRRLPTGKSDT
ncbi:MAG: hypothetical protein WCQ91_03870 [Planctomycetota bacterium]